MSSVFSERLDFLMKLTGTSNSALARALSFDASYISRIRNGRRGIPLRQPFIAPASVYLATRVREPYQQQTLAQALRVQGCWPADDEAAAALLEMWLGEKQDELDTSFERFFGSFSRDRSGDPPLPDSLVASGDPADGAVAVSVSCYLGKEGKRRAVIRFLSRLSGDGRPHMLLLYSDENMEWLTEDPAFARRWAGLLLQLLGNGGHVTIIHTLTREIGEMLQAVQKWLPMYLTGGIESYYCPRLRDGVCRRTVFVARGEAAITSSSIGECSGPVMSQLSTHELVVQAAEDEFYGLLSLCRPLVTTVAASSVLDGGHVPAVGAGGTLFASEGVTAEGISRVIGSALSEDGRSSLEGEISRRGITASARLPRDVAVLLGEDDGFILIHLAKPQIALQVSERLLTAALVQYLRS